MTSDKHFDCCIIGQGKLTLECAQQLLNSGHKIHGIVSPNLDVRRWAKEHGIETITPSDNQSEFLKQWDFDYLFSIINPNKVSNSLLSLPKIKAINYHDAPLPRYAGLHVTSWAVVNQEKSFGVTWHEMTEDFDSGQILQQVEFDIEPDDTAFSLNIKCFQKGQETFAELIIHLANGTETLRPQDLSKRSSFLASKRPDSAAIIDWSTSGTEIEAFARGLDYQTDDNPLGLPKVRLKNTFYIPTEILLSTESSTQQQAGTILQIKGNEIHVATSDYALVIKSLLSLDGEAIQLTKLNEFYEGAVFETQTEIELKQIHSSDHKFGRSELFWKDTLLNAEPFTLATHGAAPISSSSNNVEIRKSSLESSLQSILTNEFPALSSSDALAGLYCCFLRRIADTDSFDIGLNAKQAVNSDTLFATRIPLNLSLDTGESIRSLLTSLSTTFELLESHGSYSRDLVVRTPLLDKPHFPVAIEILDTLSDNTSGKDDTLILALEQNSTDYQWAINGDSLGQESADQIIEKFEFFLTNALSNLDTPLSNIYLISEEEMKKILVDWNQTNKTFENDKCIHQLFEQQVMRQPNATALVFRDQEISYTELNQKANILAEKLIKMGSTPDALIGIFIERSIEMMIGLLAIQKSGAAYVPLDPAYPRDRIALMISDSDATILLTVSKLVSELPANNASVISIDEIISIDKNSNATSAEDIKDFDTGVTPEHLAYVIYTSGSTGKPKGVMVEHRNVLNFMAGMDDTLGFDKNQDGFDKNQDQPGTWLAVTSISFDISVLELFWTLTRGFKVIIQEEEARTIGTTTQKVSNVKRKMDIGLFYFSSDAGPDTKGDRYKLLIEGAKFADANSFSAVWTPERHFHLFGGLYPNPSVTSAAVATITKNISIRAGSIVLPLHNPIRVVEEWSVVDNLSNGRVGFSFASGWHANDFALKPENFKDRKKIMFDGIDTVRKLWRGESVEVMNGEGKPFEATVYPPTIQEEPPIWITTAGNIETFRQAGEGGFNVLTNLLGQSIEDITEKIAAYRAGRKDKGHTGEGNVSVMVHTFVGTDVDEVREIVREPFCNYLKTSFDLVKIAPWAFPAFKQPSKSAAQDNSFDATTFTDEDLDALIDHAFDRYFETAGIFGTPTSILPLIDQLKTAGIDEIACLIDFGVDNDTVLQNLPNLSKLRELSNPVSKTNEQEFSIAAQIKKHDVTHFQCTPSMARILASDDETLSAISSLQKVLLGGEALPTDLANSLKENLTGDLINVYGPTETTIWSTSGFVPADTSNLTIGRPIANTNIYILDSAMHPTPIGVPGELMIGGQGVVRGYHKRPDLTADRFIDNPLNIKSDPRIYRTGDLAKYCTNGEIEFLGRLDHQVKLRGYRIELGEIESLINEVTGVKESVVIAPETEQGTQSLLAYVVPGQQNSNHTTSHWQTIWDEAYKGNTAIDDKEENDPIEDPCFNVSGWLDSYTGNQHDESHMREWVNTTVDRISELKPKRILEIGCGTGLLLYRLAPQCDTYVAVDFSDSALALIAEQVETLGLKNVSLIQSAADALSLDNPILKDNGPFDVIVINSVIQYFPSANYLTKVTKNIITALTQNGKIFFGDVRSLALKDLFHMSLEVAKAPASLTIPELKERIKEHHENESELVISPDFFYNLAKEIPAIGHVDIQLKRGKHRNEMSAFRYDVVLQLGDEIDALSSAQFSAIPMPSSLSELQQILKTTSELIVVRDIPNARTASDFLTRELLATDDDIRLVSDLHSKVAEQLQLQQQQQQLINGFQPEDIYQIDTSLRIELTWASSKKNDCFDAYFYPTDRESRLQLDSSNPAKSLDDLCFEPQQQSSDYELADRLKEKLREKLPDFMVPSEFVMLAAMPLTPNGKINRKALPKPEKRIRVTKEEFVAPESDIEQTIAEVFQEMLNLEKIGTRDNFFSLGANSLLIAQANNRLSQKLSRPVSLVAMYRFPTIAKLAEFLSGNADDKKSTEKGAERGAKRKAALGARRRRVRR